LSAAFSLQDAREDYNSKLPDELEKVSVRENVGGGFF
jgi:hypothetical protein